MLDVLKFIGGGLLFLAIVLAIGMPLVWLGEWRRNARYRRLARELGGEFRAAVIEGEVAEICGTSEDGLTWTLRLVYDYSESEDESGCHLIWQTQAVALDQVVAVVGDGPGDERLGGTWAWHSGQSPVESDRARAAAFDANLRGLIDRLDRASRPRADPGSAEAPAFTQDPSGFDIARGLLGATRKEIARPMQAFFNGASPFALPGSLAGVWHAFATDESTLGRALTHDVASQLHDWHARNYHPTEGFLRMWVGGPDLRIEARTRDASIAAYRTVIDLGLMVARSLAAEFAD
jgi:hypothetical protein